MHTITDASGIIEHVKPLPVQETWIVSGTLMKTVACGIVTHVKPLLVQET